MSKLFFNEDIGNAILQAAKSNNEFLNKKENIENTYGNEHDGDDDETTTGDSFLHRLHKNSKWLTMTNGAADYNDDDSKKISELINEEFFINKKNGVNKKIDFGDVNDARIIVEFPTTTICKLNELFGDDNANNENKDELVLNQFKSKAVEGCKVSLPLWVCELLYKAIQGIPIPDSLEQEAFDSSDTEYDQDQNKRRKGKSNKNGKNIKMRISDLEHLYDMFSDIPRKTIKEYAKENNYDVELTANHLLNIVSELSELNISDGINDEIVDDECDKLDFKQPVIILSSRPHAISEEAQKCSTPPPSLVTKYQSNEEIMEIQKQLDLMQKERQHYIEMAKISSGSKNASLRGHYMRRAKEVFREKKRLEHLCDRQRVWTHHDEIMIDLHGISFERALELIKYKIDVCREKHPNFRKLYIITGYGKSTGQPSVIRSGLLKYLKQNGIECLISKNNPGVVQIRLGNIHQRLTTD